VLRRFCQFALLVASLLCSLSTFAATVSVSVTDRNGKPLADAVVMLAPLAGHLPVRPMSGVEIAQTHRQFSPQVSVVTVGTAVAFPNLDTVRHHVYSFSPVKTFELKLYAGVPASPVVFDKPGIAVLGCNIHDDMVAWVVVVDTPLFARSAAGGKAQIDGVPAGSYTLRVWHSELADATVPLAMPLVVDAEKVEARAALATSGARK
jgi:plastocyanin